MGNKYEEALNKMFGDGKQSSGTSKYKDALDKLFGKDEDVKPSKKMDTSLVSGDVFEDTKNTNANPNLLQNR
jgi:hypothetical protein